MANSLSNNRAPEFDSRGSLHDDMQKYYVDSEGKTVHEAVTLGISILHFYDAMFKCMGMATQSKTPRMMNSVADFFISLVLESFNEEALQANTSAIEVGTTVLKDMDKEVGLEVDKTVHSEFKQIVSNELMSHGGTNLLIRVLVIEAVMRIVNVYVFAAAKDEDIRNDEISMTNYLSIYHSLAMIAYLCNSDQENYFKMNICAESYAQHVKTEITEMKA